MSTGSRFQKIATALFLSSALFWGLPNSAEALSGSGQRKTAKKKQPELPPLPSGPTGRPVQQVPLDSMPAVPPQVTYENNQLTIVAPNSTLADILRAVRKQTGAEIDVPSAPERVVTHIGPGPARDVVAELLNGSRFNYVLLGSPSDTLGLSRIVLVVKTGPQALQPDAAPADVATTRAMIPGVSHADNPPQAAEEETQPDANEAEAADDNNADENAEQQPGEAEQQNPQEQPGVKTPQQMLQEMQQRQLQMQQQQQQQQNGQPPIPGTGMPPHPPQQD